MATNRAAIRRMMGPREGFTDELSPKEQAEMRARSRRVARARMKDKSKDLLGAYGVPFAIVAAAVAGILYLKKREKDKANAGTVTAGILSNSGGGGGGAW